MVFLANWRAGFGRFSAELPGSNLVVLGCGMILEAKKSEGVSGTGLMVWSAAQQRVLAKWFGLCPSSTGILWLVMEVAGTKEVVCRNSPEKPVVWPPERYWHSHVGYLIIP